jgi:HEAT repeat protein
MALRDPRKRYPVLLGVYAAIYIIAVLPVPVLPLVGLAVGYIGVLAVGRAWVANEKQRTLISKKLMDGDPNSLPDLRWTALVSALQLLILFPLIFQQVQRQFDLFHVPEGTHFGDWFLFTLDTYNRAFLNLLEVYGVGVHRITYDADWGRHLVTICRLTFDFLLIQGVYRLFSIRETVRDAVMAVTRDTSMPTFVGRRAVPPLINALASTDEKLRAKSAEALGLMNDRRAIEPLVSTLVDPAESVRFSAAVALTKLGNSKAVEPLISVLGQQRDFHERAQAAAGLGTLADVRAVEPLIQALDCVGFEVRWNAAEALGKLRDPRAVGPLAKALLHDEEGAVRQTAAQALGLLKGPKVVDALIEALNDGVYQVRAIAINALAQTGDQRAVDAIVAALRNTSFSIRSSWNAAEALGKLGDPRAVGPLAEALREDKDSDVRLIAAVALGELRDVRAVEPLIEALKDTDPGVRQNAVEALGSELFSNVVF